MPVKHYISVLLIGSAVGAFALAAMIFLSFHMENKAMQVSGRASDDFRNVESLTTASRELLAVFDILTTEQSGVAIIAQRSVEQCRTIFAELALCGSFATDPILSELVGTFERMVEQVEHVATLAESDPAKEDQLQRFDTVAMAYLDLLARFEEKAGAIADRQVYQLVERSTRIRLMIFACGVLLLIGLVVLRGWISARLVRPLHALINATTESMRDEKEFALEETGPLEIRTLTRTVRSFIGSLEDKITQRTRDIERTNLELEVQKEEAEASNAELIIANEHLALAQATALEATKSKSEFLANMSHELRTPLNGVIGMTELLLVAGLNEKQMRFAQTAKISANVLLNLINDILDLAKVESGKLELEHLDFDLWEVVEGVTDIMAHKAAEKKLELASFIDPDIPQHVCGDPGRVQQILVNLTSNAVKFTQQGEVVVRATLEQETERDVVLRFIVQDSGIGIPRGRLDRLFKPFSQADASTTRQFGGTGLGLRISKQLAELMGGDIGVDSEEGRGSTFWFTVRLQKLDQPVDLSKRRLAHDQLKALRTLVVDDNETNREILRQQLTGWGVDVESAADGPTALQMMRDAANRGRPFELAILDMQMPEMDGAQLGNAIKSDPQLGKTVLIMLTSLMDDDAHERIKEVGFFITVSKPVKQSLLLDAILRAVVLMEPNGTPALASTLETPATDTSRALNPRGARVLLVEDNEINQDVALNILEMAGYQVDLACNGVEAVEAVRNRQYDAILMDCQMPEMDGFEATRRIREMERVNLAADRGTSPVLIVAVTANALKGDRDRCIASGMDDYISKPLVPDTLVKAIESGLRAGSRITSTSEGSEESAMVPDGIDDNASLSPPTAPAFDTEALCQRCLGNVDLIEKVLNKFQADANGLLDQLASLVEANDPGEVAKLAHLLKGMAANLSANELQQAACGLESLAREARLDAGGEVLAQLRTEVEHCLNDIPAVLAKARNN